MKAWDADMTPEQRQAAIQQEIKRTQARENAGAPCDTWSDPRTANLVGNYITR